MPPKQVTVEDASASPSPPPSELKGAASGSGSAQVESVDGAGPVDQPIDSLGSDSDEEGEGSDAAEEEEEWDPAEERLPGQVDNGKGKGKGKAKKDAAGEEVKDDQPWQAVWAPEQNAWYFWNTKTSEVSWTNPLEPASSSEPGASAQPPLPDEAPPLPSGPAPTSSAYAHAQTQAQAPMTNAWESTDPSLPEIDEGLLHMVGGGGSTARGGAMDPTMQRATFNARTGRFTPQDYQYTVGHLDEYNRAKRMSNHYFDVDAWERDKAAEHEKRRREEEAGGVSKKQITKKDMERFRRKAAEKKMRSQAWLRE
ncbi:hypothetical protein IAU60_006581 [Kwoniella sp. DSM 27419]